MSFMVSAGAREDVATAARFYNSRPGRYGAAFKREFAGAGRAIAANPRMYPPVEDGLPEREIREFYIDRFEQRVIYAIREGNVIVFAVVHASARPESWHDRLTTDIPPEAPQ
ncbi:MAG: type toxin-antitoxin system RelE/ParE family toxin [Gemmataceae bacterium]|nr:type toxin-antitoxin system RelE/ParE family toxin [Gemmataceae bacterium]